MMWEILLLFCWCPPSYLFILIIWYMAYWGYAASVATVLVALIGPVLGSVADTRNYK